jgi:hypothetical protein
MSATGLTTDAIKNIAANAYAGAALYLTLLKALTLQSATSVGAATFSVDLSVQAGDILVFDQGLSSQEQVNVSSVSGSGPYTVTPATTLTKAHAASAKIGHVPVSSSTVHEVSVTRVAANWGSPSPAGVVTTSADAITVPSGNVVGSVALFSASTAGTYYDATAVNAQDFTAAGGSYTPVWVESFT